MKRGDVIAKMVIEKLYTLAVVDVKEDFHCEEVLNKKMKVASDDDSMKTPL